jgi:arginase
VSPSLALVGAPTSAGAFAPGQEDAPAALRDAGIVAALRAAGLDVIDRGDTPRFRWRVDHDEPRAMNAAAVADGVRAVAAHVEEVLRGGDRVLVLGGDCTVGVGTVAGAVAAGAEPRLLYFDMHADLNRPHTVPDGALDWTGVAHMLDVEGAHQRVLDALPRRPLLADDDLVLLAVRPQGSTAAEREVIEARGLDPITLDDVAADPAGSARTALALATAGGRRYLVHFDVDVIDFADVPLSENADRGIGLTFDAALAAVEVLVAHDALLGLTVTELNPHHGAADGADVARLARRLAGALAPAGA